MDKMARFVCWAVVAVCAASAAGCGSGSVTGPSEVPTAQEPATAPLAVPDRLRGVWASADEATGLLARYGGNVVVFTVATWGEDITPAAVAMRERGVGALVYVEQCLLVTGAAREACWARVETWAKPLSERGLLWGYHTFDEPAQRGVSQALRDEADAWVQAKGYPTLQTEWIDAVKHRDYRMPRSRWYGVTCYDYGGTGDSRNPLKGVKWHIQNCADEYARRPDWNTVVGQGFDAGNGLPDRARWEAIAAGRGLLWWTKP